MTQPPPPPGWYPDPAGTGGSRWWNGQGWSDALQPAAPPPPPPGPPAPAPPHAGGMGSPLYEQPVLVVSQKAKRMELTSEYAVFDGQGNQIGAVVQIGQSALKKGGRLFSELDQFFTLRLEVRDARGLVLVLTRPTKNVKLRVLVSRPDGAPVGEIVQANAFGKTRFELVAGGHLVGAMRAENWRLLDFAIADVAGTEVARITKRWKGLSRSLFTTARQYAVHVHSRLPDPLASMVIASALTVDTALNQDERFD